jgi:hypothetical protein
MVAPLMEVELTRQMARENHPQASQMFARLAATGTAQRGAPVKEWLECGLFDAERPLQRPRAKPGSPPQPDFDASVFLSAFGRFI